MKKASSTLISHLNRHKIITHISYFSSSSSPTLTKTTQHHQNNNFTPCTKSNAVLLIKPNNKLFQTSPSRNLNTLVEKTPPHQSSSSLPPQKIKSREEIAEAFLSAKTADEMLAAFKVMESAFDENELGSSALKLGLQLDQEDENPEKIISFATRALNALDQDADTGNNKPSRLVAMALQLMGSANYSLKRFDDSLGYLNRANRELGRLEEEDLNSNNSRQVWYVVQSELADVKMALGRREEACVNLKKCLEIKEMMCEEDSKELGKVNRDLGEGYVSVLNFKEALPYCLKALDIHKAHLGTHSVAVAHDRHVLGVIYTGLEMHEKALEQNELSQKVLKNLGMNSKLLLAEIDAANMKIALGKYDEAINSLKGVVQKTDKDSETRALVFVSMAKALCSQEKLADTKRLLEISYGILDKKETEKPIEVAEGYMQIAMQYETMNEFETAISLLKRTLAILEKVPREQHSAGTVASRIGWLLFLTGKVQQAIPYLESAAETVKECFGPKHFGVACVYNNLGDAYMEIGRPQSAAQMFGFAKDIMEVSRGPHHLATIESVQNLSKAYSAMGSYSLAIEFQQQAIEAYESLGPTAENELKEAQQLLEQIKKEFRGSSSNEFPT